MMSLDQRGAGAMLVLKEIRFQNFRALRQATLPLSRVTMIVGPNGSGKSTVLQSIKFLAGAAKSNYDDLVSVDRRNTAASVEVKFVWDDPGPENAFTLKWEKGNAHSKGTTRGESQEIQEFTSRMRVFSLNPSEIAQPVPVTPNVQLEPGGRGLAAVLDNLRDTGPERFDLLNAEIPNWLPEFDRVVLSVPSAGSKVLSLRRKSDGHLIVARDLSDGTLYALVLLTLAHLPSPPSLVGLEDPDHGLHPRLMRRVQDAMYRLAYPERSDAKRTPTQVIATTHSPYFLDLFKEHPEEVVFANKDERGVTFQRLSDRPRIDEILPEGPLGELWYSGLLGGVPSQSAQP
jgi:predicted ATPase